CATRIRPSRKSAAASLFTPSVVDESPFNVAHYTRIFSRVKPFHHPPPSCSVRAHYAHRDNDAMSFRPYVEHGWKLCRIKAGEKGPRYTGWNRPGREVTAV